MTIDERLHAIDGLDENQIKQIKLVYDAAGVAPSFQLDNLIFELQTITGDALFCDTESGRRLYMVSGRPTPLTEIIDRFKRAAAQPQEIS